MAGKSELDLWQRGVSGRKKSNNTVMILWTAFIVGLFGSMHCIGMCGPITLALPGFHNHIPKVVSSRLLYNIGRTITYAFMGALIGLAGEGISLAGAQRWVSIASGILLIVIVLIPSSLSSRFNILKPAYHFTDYLKKKFGPLLKSNSLSSVFVIGVLNGFLPCGLVYVALAGALATGSLVQGTLYMAFFGLGTIPLLFAFSVFGQFIGASVRRRFNKIVPVFIVVLGIIFILRGMNLGIPYISPKLGAGGMHSHQTEEQEVCH
jgi:sulfite exporter TauE/SafE